MQTLFAFSALWLHQLSWPKIEFYIIFHAKKNCTLCFHVIDIKRRFQRTKLLYYLERYRITEYVG